MDTLNLREPGSAASKQPVSATRKTVEYLYATSALGMRIAHGDAFAFDPSLRWCLLEFRTDDDDVGRELSRYFSLSAPKAIIEARRALADAKAVHLSDVGSLEFDLDEAEQRWVHACRQKLQALRVKVTEMRAHTAPDAHEVALHEACPDDEATGVAANAQVMNGQVLAPHYFIYLAPDLRPAGGEPVDTANISQSLQLQLRARNYVGDWLLEENVEVHASAVALRGWPLPAFRRWVQGVIALRRKPPRYEAATLPGDCVLAAGDDFCLVMDLATFARATLPQDK
ncbi:hypothetical protein [Paraburkholderia azotifigens]|uniref:Uncharacterized protein n=1 Tax=Paraburkholderia azotifigens TaxID=2057004 RepID=A0A5C6VP25_9BURK|nr:hypothetical protein [Paraburkholderia azotifigens]TXC86391.1 hypothetical protein FRZ40_01675 [Paraburkholderia azotifigens]